MNRAVTFSWPGREGSFYCRRPQGSKVHNELLELYVIFQAKVLHVRDASGWRDVFNKSVRRLLSIQPLQSLTKRGRLAVVMCIVRGGRTDLFAPTVLAVLACDWVTDEWEPFKLLQGTVRQAALSDLRSKSGSTGVPSRHWSRSRMASMVEDGVASTIADSWRGLGIKGTAREQVEKTGRELRGLAARCRGASDRSRARELLSSYLESNRLESFVEALVVWGREQLIASKPTIFDVAFPFLEAGHVQPPRGGADRLDSDRIELDDDHAQGGVERLEGMDERGVGGSAFPTPPDCHERSQSVSVPSTTEDGGHRRSRLDRGWSRSASAADDGASNTDDGSRLSHSLLPQEASDMHQADSQAASPPSGAEAGQERGIHSCATAATFGDVKPGRERRRLGVLRADEKVFVQMGTSREIEQWRLGAVAAVRGDGTYDIRYDNGEVDRLVRRADIFEATSSGGHAPQVSMELEDESRGEGVDVARNGHGDLRSRQKKRRKLARFEDSPPLSPDTPDTQPVWEERTPARPALFQDDEPWSTTGADIGTDTPSPMQAGTKEESGAVRRWLQRRNKKRKIVVDQDNTTSDECDEPLPIPLSVPLPTTECLPAEINDFATGKCDIEAPHGVNEVEVRRSDGGGGYHGEALQTPETSNLGRVEARELKDPGNGVGEDGFMDATANPTYRQGVGGMGADSSAVFLEPGHSARLDAINALHGTRARAGVDEGREEEEEEEEEAQDDDVETDEELVGGARRGGGWKEEEHEEEEKGGAEEEEEEEEKGEEEEEQEEDTDEEFVGMQECEQEEEEDEEDEQASSIRVAKEGNEEDENGEGAISRTAEGDANFARRIDTRPFQLQYDSRPPPSPASPSSMPPLQSPAAAGRARSPLTRNEIASASDQLDRLDSEDRQQNDGQGQRDFVECPHAEEVDTCQHGGASHPVAEEIRGNQARVDDSSGHPDRRAGAERPDGMHPDFETPTHDSMVPLMNQRVVATERGGGSSATVPSATVADLGHAENSTCRKQDEDETSAQQRMEKLPDEFYDVVRGVVDTREQNEDETNAQQGMGKPPDEFHDVVGVTDDVVDGVVDTQSPSRPSHFMRVYGSAGITRVGRTVGDWLSQRWPTL